MAGILKSVAWLLLLSSQGNCAEPSIDWNREALSGNWGGERSSLSARGIDVQFMLRATMLDNLAGGAARGAAYMQNVEAKFGFDGEKLWSLPGSSAYVHLIANQGGKFNKNYAGTAMGVDNSETPDNTAKLYQAWFGKNFLEEKLSVLLGIYPIDTEFYVNDAAGIFLHPSFGMAAEVAQTNANGPSIYPLSSLGARVKYLFSPVFYAQAALLDADPGNSSNPHWAHFQPAHGDGSLAIVEWGYYPAEVGHTIAEIEAEKGTITSEARRLEEKYEGAGKYAVGQWSYSKPVDDLSGSGRRNRNRGWYFLAEQSLFRPDDLSRDFAVFVRYGRAQPDVNPADYSLSYGMRYRGMFEHRSDDTFGVAVTQLHSSPFFALPGERALEITYRMQLKPWIAVQPVLQLIRHPAGNPALNSNMIAGVRLDLWL